MSGTTGRLERPTALQRAQTALFETSARVPQFTLEREADVGSFVAARRSGEPTIVDHLVVACARALREHPRMNARHTPEGVLVLDDVNISLAMATEAGLMAPAVLSADRLEVREVQNERRRLSRAADERALTAIEVYDGTFTISNLGPFGVSRFRSLVTPPQASSLAVGAVSVTGQITLALSVDHRVLDGAPAAQFLASVVRELSASTGAAQ